MRIDKFDFDESLENKLNKKRYMIDKKPIVYIICNEEFAYIGISDNSGERSKSHSRNSRVNFLTTLYVIYDDRFNDSVIREIEKYLIRYLPADKKYKLKNKNKGERDNHEYSNKDEFFDIFKELWDELRKIKLVKTSIPLIETTSIFKFSPYTYLDNDQYDISKKILKEIEQGNKKFLISGGPGTGKTVLAIYLMKYLIDHNEQNLKIGFVVPNGSLRSTLEKVFDGIEGFDKSMVLKPTKVAEEMYDILIVDEAHRLKRRKGLSRSDYNDFDRACGLIGLNSEKSNELDIIESNSKVQILFYDKLQKIRKSDIEFDAIKKFQGEKEEFKLKIQHRIKGGNRYVQFIYDLLQQKLTSPTEKDFGSYEFKVFDRFVDFKKTIEKREEEYKLSRMLAGFAWEWDKKAEVNFWIEGIPLKWNSKTKDWVNSKKSKNEVGCIHTIQGYELNYAGVIIGPELIFDDKENKIKVVKQNYKDRLGYVLTDEKELKEFIIDIYAVLLTRGIRGTYLYICDEKLREYFKKYIKFN